MRTKKAFYNITVSLIYQFVSVICGLITPRLILSAFGSTFNGVVSSATQFLSMISVLTLGIAGATRVAFYKTLANNDIVGTSRIMKATKNYMRKVAYGIIVYACLLCIIYPFISHNELTRMQNAAIIAIVSIGTFADYFFGISNITLLSADQSGYISASLNIIKIVLNTILVGVLIRIGANVYIVKLGSSIVYFIIPFVLNLIVKKKYGLIDNCEPDNTGIKNRGAVAFHSIANIIHRNTDLFVLTLFTDAKIISVYTVYYLVIGKIGSIMEAFTNGLEAAFGNMWAKKEYNNLNNYFATLEYALSGFTAAVFSCVGILILPFIRVYTSGVTDVNYIRSDLAILFTLSEGLYCLRQPYLILVQATGNYEATKKGAVLEAAVNLLASLVLVIKFDLCGVIIGTILANSIRTLQYAWFIYKNVIKKDFKVLGRRFVWIIVDVIAIVIVCNPIVKTFTENGGWGNWLLLASIVFLIACIITVLWTVPFYLRDLKKLMAIFSRMICGRLKRGR